MRDPEKLYSRGILVGQPYNANIEIGETRTKIEHDCDGVLSRFTARLKLPPASGVAVNENSRTPYGLLNILEGCGKLRGVVLHN